MEINELFKKYHKNLFKYCENKYKLDYDTCHELVQLTFLKVMKLDYVNSFSYLKYTLSSIFIDNYRKNKRQHILLINNDNELLDYLKYRNKDSIEIDNSEKINKIKNLVKDLSPKYKRVFELYYYDNLEHLEIAEYLGINEGTSKSNLHKAKNKIRELIK